MQYETLKTSTPADNVLLVELNRPDAANAFNTVMSRELIDLFEALSLDAGEVRAVVMETTGDVSVLHGPPDGRPLSDALIEGLRR